MLTNQTLELLGYVILSVVFVFVAVLLFKLLWDLAEEAIG